MSTPSSKLTNYAYATHGYHDSVLRAHQSRTAQNSAAYLLPSLRPDMNILDVGCGPGTITADFAALVYQGYVVAFDVTEDVVEHARTHAEQRGLDNITFQVGSVLKIRPAAKRSPRSPDRSSYRTGNQVFKRLSHNPRSCR